MVSMSKNEVNLDNRRQVADEKATPVLEYDEPLLIFPLRDWVDYEEAIPGEPVRDTATNGSGSSPPCENSTTKKSVSLLARGGN